MSSLGARRVVRTYSRQRKLSLYDEEPPTKRRRVDTAVETCEEDISEDGISSPPPRSSRPALDTSPIPPPSPKKSTAIFSDEPPRSTPPSSPIQQQSSSPTAPRRRPVFPSLRRKPKQAPPVKEPLSGRSSNVPSPPRPPKQPPKQKRLVQMQLDLVAETFKTCKVCGMEYIPSHADDAALHRKFHAMNVGGIDISKTLVEKLKQNQIWSGGDRSFIAVISRKDTLALRNRACDVLRVVNTELGAVPIPDEALWSQIRNSIAANAQVQGEKAQQSRSGSGAHTASDRFKAYLYIRAQKCVGMCLAERIQEAFTVLGQDDASEPTGQLPADYPSSSISISDTPEPAILGISRIWTSNLHRHHGIATRLLDSATSDFLYGMTVDKAEVAFSQPTESGGRLARKWFGRQDGWHVYID